MALKGKPRDMHKWRKVIFDANVHFHEESIKYRRARNELLDLEAAFSEKSKSDFSVF